MGKALNTVAHLSTGGIIPKKAFGGFLGKGQAAPTTGGPMDLPQTPSPAQSEMAGEKAARARKASMTKTVFSSPLGAAGEAAIAKKTLLGL